MRPRMQNVFLIAGLGNPGAEYVKTRHNAGFLLVEKLAARWKAEWKNERRFQARIANVERASRPPTGGMPVPQRILLCQPQTFMNLSGGTVGALKNFYQLPLNRLLVAVDDADLPLGEIRLRARGSSGGHHGLESIEQHLATREFARLRIGIGRADGAREITDYVLARFAAGERELMEKVLDRAAGQAECWLDAGIEKAMNRFNGLVESLNGNPIQPFNDSPI
jgi:PTH1 family peptidyl-tRNA hydrolase